MKELMENVLWNSARLGLKYKFFLWLLCALLSNFAYLKLSLLRIITVLTSQGFRKTEQYHSHKVLKILPIT